MDENQKTQAWVAEKVGVSQPNMSRVLGAKGLKRGSGFSPEVAVKLNRLTAIPLESLLFKGKT